MRTGAVPTSRTTSCWAPPAQPTLPAGPFPTRISNGSDCPGVVRTSEVPSELPEQFGRPHRAQAPLPARVGARLGEVRPPPADQRRSGERRVVEQLGKNEVLAVDVGVKGADAPGPPVAAPYDEPRVGNYAEAVREHPPHPLLVLARNELLVEGEAFPDAPAPGRPVVREPPRRVGRKVLQPELRRGGEHGPARPGPVPESTCDPIVRGRLEGLLYPQLARAGAVRRQSEDDLARGTLNPKVEAPP